MLGQQHPNTLISMNNLAALYFIQGRYELAEPIFQKTLDLRREVSGQQHPYTLNQYEQPSHFLWKNPTMARR